MINCKLSWEDQVSCTVNKVIKRNYCLKKFASVIQDKIFGATWYISLIRSILEYSCVVWHFGLTVAQCKKLEKQSKFAHKILGLHKQDRLKSRREIMCCKKYIKIEQSDNILKSFICQKMIRTSK